MAEELVDPLDLGRVVVASVDVGQERRWHRETTLENAVIEARFDGMDSKEAAYRIETQYEEKDRVLIWNAYRHVDSFTVEHCLGSAAQALCGDFGKEVVYRKLAPSNWEPTWHPPSRGTFLTSLKNWRELPLPDLFDNENQLPDPPTEIVARISINKGTDIL